METIRSHRPLTACRSHRTIAAIQGWRQLSAMLRTGLMRRTSRIWKELGKAWEKSGRYAQSLLGSTHAMIAKSHTRMLSWIG